MRSGRFQNARATAARATAREAGHKADGREYKRAGKTHKGFPASLLVALFGVATVLAFFLARARRVGVVDEDAYISFRYARNLINGDGLVFNPGAERVEGITNLLWTLVVAGGSWISGLSLPGVAVALGLLCGGLTLVVAYRWCYEELVGGGLSTLTAYVAALAAPSLLVLAPGFAFYSASGLEVSLFALLITAGLYLLTRARSEGGLASGSTVLGLAAMTRPEGALVLTFGAAASALISKGSSAGERLRGFALAALPGAAVILAFTAWRLYYYGSPIPNTAFAKAGGVEVMQNWGWPYLIEAAGANLFHIAWLLALVGALLDRGLLGRALGPLCLVPVWSAYVVYAGGDYMPFQRFVVPLLPFIYVLAVAGFARICVTLPGTSRLPRSAKAAAVLLPVAALGVLVAYRLPEQLEAEEQWKAEIVEDTEIRRAAGEWFDAHRPDALVARNAVGAFGYYSNVRILDMIGLNNEHIARHGHKAPSYIPGHQSGDGEYVLSRDPDYIIVTNTEPPFRFVSDRELAGSPEFHREYQRVTAEIGDGRRLSMFERKEAG